jgi:hypothetical protein
MVKEIEMVMVNEKVKVKVKVSTHVLYLIMIDEWTMRYEGYEMMKQE